MVLLNGRYQSRTVGLAYYSKCQKSTFFYVEHPLNGFRFCHAVLNGTHITIPLRRADRAGRALAIGTSEVNNK